MTPIERISARSRALEVLGMSGHPSRSELRSAFRRLAFEKHPDQGNGGDADFARISDAYHLLSDSAQDDVTPVRSRSARVSRPSVQGSDSEFSDSVVQACSALFSANDGPPACHVATRLYRKGRTLTYFVPTRPCVGANRVALPTGDLVDTRSIRPALVDVPASEIAVGVYDVPSSVRTRVFPGAHNVQIRFSC